MFMRGIYCLVKLGMKRPRVLEDRGDLAHQDHLVGPAVLLPQVERGQAGHERRERPGRGERPLVGAHQAVAIPPGPAEHPDGLAVERGLFLLVEFHRLPQARPAGPRARRTRAGSSPDRGSWRRSPASSDVSKMGLMLSFR